MITIRDLTMQDIHVMDGHIVAVMVPTLVSNNNVCRVIITNAYIEVTRADALALVERLGAADSGRLLSA